MSRQVNFEYLVPEAPYAETVGEEVRNLRRLCLKTLAEALQGEIGAEAIETLASLRDRLALAIVTFRVKAAERRHLAFTERERLILDFGLLDERLVKSEINAISFCRDEITRPEVISSIRVQYVSEILDSRFQAILRVPEEKMVRRRLAEARAAIAARKQDVKRLQVRRDAAVRSQSGLRPLARVFKEMDEALPQYAWSVSRMESSSGPTSQERRVYHSLGKKYAALRDEESFLLGTLDAQEELSLIASEIITTTMQIPKYETDIANLQEELDAIRRSRAELLRQELVERLHEEMDELYSRLRLCGGRFIRQTRVLLTKADGLQGKIQIIRAVEAVLAGDVELAQNWREERWRRPAIGLLPGRGDAVYEEAGHRIWVPIVMHRNPERSVAAAMGNYRLSADRDILAEFGSLRTYASIRSVRKLREKFVRAYVTWCLSDSKGFRSLPKEVYNWFIRRIYQSQPAEDS